MAAADDDWRLEFQQEPLAGVAFRRRRYAPEPPEWDHDHCWMCNHKFVAAERASEFPDAAFEGYAALPHGEFRDACHWICAPCFDDFHERFGWTAVEQVP